MRAAPTSATLRAMKVLVTGAEGFVGQRLLPRLGAVGHLACGFDRDTVDICDRVAVSRVVSETRPDAIIHLAGISFIPQARSEPDLAWKVNVEGTRNLILATESETPKARLLLVGSGDQYAPRSADGDPLDEEAQLTPQGVYARSKAAAEDLGLEAAERGLDVIRVRAFNHTGAGQEPRFVAPDFASQIARIEAGAPPFMRVGNLESVRDFLHVDDVVEAYIKLLEPSVPSNVYNVASGVATEIGQLLKILADLAGVEPETQRDDDRWRPADSRVGDARKLRKATGWSPLHSLPEILSELLEHWRMRIKEDRI